MAENPPAFDDWAGGGATKQSFDEWAGRPIKSEGITGYAGHLGREIYDAYSRAVGKTTGLDPESEQWLKDKGIFNDYKSGFVTTERAMLEGMIRTSAAALDVFMGGLAGGFKGYQEGVTEFGRRMEGGAVDRWLQGVMGPGGGVAKLARDVAAIPESIGSLVPGHGVKTGFQVNRHLNREMFEEAKRLGIVGPEVAAGGKVEIAPIDVTVSEPTLPRQSVDIAPITVTADRPRLPSVAERVSQDLVAAGRPQAEAEAYGALMQARYETRAARLGTTADELFAAEGPEIRAGRGVKVGERELAQDAGAQRIQSTPVVKIDGEIFIGENHEQALERAARARGMSESVNDLVDGLGGWNKVRDNHFGYLDASDEFVTAKEAFRRSSSQEFEQTSKGKINIREGERNIITMMRNSDASTFGHETGHQFLDELFVDAKDARAPQDLIRDRNIISQWLEIKADTDRLEIPVKAHEKFARGWEQYLREGKAPTKELQGVFDRFRDWLLRIYRSVRDLKVEINDDVRGVFDRLIAINPEKRVPGAADRLIEQSLRAEGAPQGRLGLTRNIGPSAKPEKQQTLLEFLADRGGLKPDPELTVILGGRNRFVPGFGSLLSKDGMSLDRAREAAVEAGYIIDHGAEQGGVTTSSIGHLLDKVDQEVRGTKVYREGKAPERVETPDMRAERLDHYHSEFAAYLDEAGLPRDAINDATSNRVIGLMDREGLTADAAYERAIMEEHHNAAQAGRAEPVGLGEEIPGWNVPDDAGPVSRASRESAGDGQPIPRETVREPLAAAAEPVTDPNQPLPRAKSGSVDKAGNIRLDNLNTPDDVNAVLREAAEQNDEFMVSRRGVLGDRQVEELADALGMDAKKLDKKKIGEAFSAEEIIAARKLLVQSATEVRDLAKAASSGLEPEVMAYAEAKARHIMIQEKVSQATAEAGRALRAFRDLEGMKEAKSIGAFLQEKTGRTLFQLQDEARKLAALDTAKAASKFINDSKKPRFTDYILEYWINALLSGYETHLANVITNEFVNKFHLLEQVTTAAVGKVRSAVTGSKERAYLGEAKAALFSELQGARDGLHVAWEVMKSEDAIIGGRQIERHGKATPGAIGEVIRTPGKLLSAEDQLFKARAYAQSFAEQAYRKAADAGLEGRAFEAEVERLRNNPTPKMVEEAHKFGDLQTFTNRLGERGKAFQLFLSRTPVLKFIAPFVQTPLNIVKYAAERSIAAPLFKHIRDDLKGENGAIARDRAIAKMTLGTAAMGSAALYIMNDMITGAAPADESERAMWYESGKQPYSIRIGDNWYSYRRIEPLSSFWGIMADAKQVWDHLGDDDQGNLAKLIQASVMNNVLNKTFLQGPVEASKAISEPERYGGRWIQRFAASFIPAGLAQPVKLTDPYLREARTIVDAAKARIPGMSQDLPAKNGIWGEPIERGPGPITVSRNRNDPVTDEFLRLGVFPGTLKREIVGQKLTDQEYEDYTRIAGRAAKIALDEFVNAPYSQQIPDHIKGRAMLKIVDKARRYAREQMKMQYPHIIFDALHDKYQEATGQ